MGDKGFPALMRAAKRFKPRGKGHEVRGGGRPPPPPPPPPPLLLPIPWYYLPQERMGGMGLMSGD